MRDTSRRRFLQQACCSVLAGSFATAHLSSLRSLDAAARRPNILLVISDDQSWPHAGAYGCRFVNTPAFDRVAREGVLFTHCFCPAPGCAPSRAALLTGMNIWQLEEAAAHASLFPRKFEVYPELLDAAGYHVGYTGKGWGPGSWEAGGRKQNPAGPEYNNKRLEEPPTEGIATHSDYLWNFTDFLQQRPEGKPFCFWCGVREPHRPFEPGSGLRAGKKLENVEVPPFLPDTDEVRSDLLDYALEIDVFDTVLGRIIDKVEEIGELDNTLIVATSDNGMGFPHAKSDLYEFGTHMPLAVRWGDRVRGGRVVDDLVSFIDLAPTFLEAAGLEPPAEMTGKSMMNIMSSSKSGRVDPHRSRVFTGKERHSHQRRDNLGYPSRAIRTEKYLYIRNFKPDRWPGGDFYADIDRDRRVPEPGTGTRNFMIAHKDDLSIRDLLDRTFAKRPTEELYLVEEDTGCLHNLAYNPDFTEVRNQLRAELEKFLTEQKDPRVLGYGDIFDSYPRFLSMRDDLPGFKERGKYNPEYQKKAEDALKKIREQRSTGRATPGGAGQP